MNKHFFMTIATVLLAIHLQTLVMGAEPKPTVREDNTQKLQEMLRWLQVTWEMTSGKYQPHTNNRASELLLLVSRFKSEYSLLAASDSEVEGCSETVKEMAKMVEAFKAEVAPQDKVREKLYQLRKRRYKEVLAESAKRQRTSGQEILNDLGNSEAVDFALLSSLDPLMSERAMKEKFARDDRARYSNY